MSLALPVPDDASGPWQSFWMGGFEGADHVNAWGRPLDMVRDSGHLERLDDDLARVASLGIGVVRESIGWRLAEPRPHRFDFDRTRRIAQATRRHGLQVVWSFMHYGTPPDVSLLDDRLIERFAVFAREAATVLAALSDRPPVYNLVNEIGFLAWAVSATDMMWPYRGQADDVAEQTRTSGWRVKCRLVQAVLAAREAVLAVDPRARFLHVEPLVHTAPPRDRPDLQPLADEIASYQWQVWDLIEGRLEPALGGKPAALDLLGVNHYHSGQWEVLTERRLHWDEAAEQRDPRRRPLHALLQQAWQRYQRPLIVAETGHIGEGRVAWLHEHAGEVRRARALGVPVHGVCLYPLLDRGDWEQGPDEPTRWHHSGLFDCLGDGTPQLHGELAAALQAWQGVLPVDAGGVASAATGPAAPALLVFLQGRWRSADHRLQPLMSRLARHRRVVVLEAPLHDAVGPPWLERVAHAPHIEVLTPRVPVAAAGISDDPLAALPAMLGAYLRDEALDDLVVWCCTAAVQPLIKRLRPRAVVVDHDPEHRCEDRPPAHAAWGATAQTLQQREAALLAQAALVVTGGPTAQAALHLRHPHTGHPPVLCLPSGVDAARFAPQGLAAHPFEAAEARALQADVPRPRLGWFGEVDARLDLVLLQQLVAARPDWHWVMVGPVQGLDPALLPQAPNLHWLGRQPAARLPHLIGQWDVCVLPLVLNTATRGQPASQLLPCLAAQKPVASTPLPDAVALYGSVVEIADDAPAFEAVIERVLQETPEARALRVSAASALVARRSWDAVADTLEQTLQQVLDERPRPLPPAGIPAPGEGVPPVLLVAAE